MAYRQSGQVKQAGVESYLYKSVKITAIATRHMNTGDMIMPSINIQTIHVRPNFDVWNVRKNYSLNNVDIVELALYEQTLKH